MHIEQEVHYTAKLSDGTKTDVDGVGQRERKKVSQNTDVKAGCLHDREKVAFQSFHRNCERLRVIRRRDVRLVSEWFQCVFSLKGCIQELLSRRKAISREKHQSSRCLVGISIVVTVQIRCAGCVLSLLSFGLGIHRTAAVTKCVLKCLKRRRKKSNICFNLAEFSVL